jgi:monoamine oxidase
VAIIGAGLAGLSLAQKLHDAGRCVQIFEARDRCGGRILGVQAKAQEQEFYFDLGPSWIWPDSQPRIAQLVKEHDIPIIPHWVKGNALYKIDRMLPAKEYVDDTTYGDAYRIEGGVERLAQALLNCLPRDIVNTNHRLQRVINNNRHVLLEFNHQQASLAIKAKQVVITIPPRLLVDDVMFTPGLDERLAGAFSAIPTWMAGHAKAVIHYDTPFWRTAGLSGNALSTYPGAALVEVYDVCSSDGAQAALSGFFALPAAMRKQYRADLEALIIDQLVRLFGEQAASPREVVIQDWFEEIYTATSEDEIPPEVHPEYGHPWLQLDHWNDKLYFGGTESAAEFGGYLEGALVAAERVAKNILI